MSWLMFAKFPLDKDLSSLHQLLQGYGIPHRFTEEQGGQCLWLADHSQAATVEQLLLRFASNDLPPPAPKRGANPNAHFAEFLWHILATPFTFALLGLGIAGYLLQTLGSRAMVDLLRFASLSYISDSGEYWRLITPAFIHFDSMHIVFNGLWLWYFGTKLEAFLGTLYYLGLFVLTALAANLLQYWLGGNASFGGLSGVVYGYAGCAMVLGRTSGSPKLAVPEGIYVFMLVMLGVGFAGIMDFFIAGSIANWAHLGGLVAGLAFALIYSLISGLLTHGHRKNHPGA